MRSCVIPSPLRRWFSTLGAAVLAFLYLGFPAFEAGAQSEDVSFRVRQLPLTGVIWGGVIGAIARHPFVPGELLAGSRTGGLFLSEDAGRTWSHVDSFPATAINSIAYAPDFGLNTVFVTTRDDWHTNNFGGVWWSRDRGAHWNQVLSVPVGPQRSGAVLLHAPPDRVCDLRPMAYGIAPGGVGPQGPEVFVATKCGVYRGTEGPDGLRWTLYPETANDSAHSDNNIFYAVKVLRSGEVVAGGETGLYYLDRVGGRFVKSSVGYLMNGKDGEFRGSFGESPIDSPTGEHIVFAAVADRPGIAFSTNGGRDWTLFHGLPSNFYNFNGGCGGAPFVRAVLESPRNVDLFYGDGCVVHWSGPFPNGDFGSVTSPFGLAPGWHDLSFATHSDPHDVEFQNTVGDLMVISDGGLEICHHPYPAYFTCESSTFEGVESGLNAIETTVVSGQHILDFPHLFASPEYPLYFGTWHDDLWSSADGINWAVGAQFESDLIQMARYAPDRESSVMVYDACAPCGYEFSGPLFDARQGWPSATDPLGPPAFVQAQGSVFSQLTGLTTSPQAASIVSGVSQVSPPAAWTQIAALQDCGPSGSGPCTDLSFGDGRLAFGGYLGPGARTNPVLYGVVKDQRVGSDTRTIVQKAGLALFTNFLGITASGTVRVGPTEVLFPSMCLRACPGLGAPADSGERVVIGYNPSDGVWRPVFGVDPEFAGHIIAPDVASCQMVETFDGGDTWAPMPDLTKLVTNFRPAASPTFKFCVNNGPNDPDIVWPLVSAISFYPENPDLVLLGTMNNGLFFSSDRGRHWENVPFSLSIPNIIDMHWKSYNSVVVASTGRGLWEVELTPTTLLSRLPAACSDCMFISLPMPFGATTDAQAGSSPSQNPFPDKADVKDALLVFDGRVTGIVLGQNGLSAVSVTPGSSRIQFATGKFEAAFQVVEQSKQGSFDSLPEAAQILKSGFFIRGFTFDKGQLTGILFGKGQAALPPADFIPTLKFPSNRTLGLNGKPYLSLSGEEMHNFTFPGGSTVTVRGQNFSPSGAINLSISGGQQVLQGIQPDAKGNFVVSFEWTLPKGYYSLLAEQAAPNKQTSIRVSIALQITHADDNEN